MIIKEDVYKKAFEAKKNALREKQTLREAASAAAYNAEPRLTEIDRSLSSIGASLAIAALSGADVTNLKKQSEALTREKKVLLDKFGVRDIKYDCPLCSDTGYVNGRICSCVKHLVAAFIAEEMSEEMPLGTSRFDNFDLKYYPDKDTKDGNPRCIMTKLFKTCYEYAFEFDPKTSGNLLFMGGVGLGKTHLTLAMVGKIIEKGFVPVYGSAENLFSLSSLYVSMIFLWVGYLIGEKIIEKCENKPKKFNMLLSPSAEESFTKTLEFVSLTLFYISVFSLFVVELEKFLYMRGRNYEEIYVSFRTQLPFFVNAIASMNKYFLCIFLATMPTKRKAILPLSLYVFSAVPYFLIGARFKLVVNALFMVVYFIIRETLENKKRWIGKFEKTAFLVSAPAVIAFLGAYNYIREGKKVAYKGFFDLIVDFFYKQGVSFEILKSVIKLCRK